MSKSDWLILKERKEYIFFETRIFDQVRKQESVECEECAIALAAMENLPPKSIKQANIAAKQELNICVLNISEKWSNYKVKRIYIFVMYFIICT